MTKLQEKLLNNKEDIIEMRKQGATYKEIAVKYETSTTTITSFIKANGNVARKSSWQDMIGKTYNNFTVLRRASKEEATWNSNETPLLIKCNDCGYEWVARRGDILKEVIICPECGEAVGRGHWDKSKIGMRFGYLTIIDKAPTHRSEGGNYTCYWTCQCDCGNIVNVSQDHLFGRRGGDHHGRTISCGCATKSSGQIKMEQICTALKINFKPEYRINEFSPYAPFDIGILDKEGQLLGLMEYDGEQHFREVELWGGEEKLKIQQERDNRKNKYCEENGIPLFRIPYTDYDELSVKYLFSKFPEFRRIVYDNYYSDEI